MATKTSGISAGKIADNLATDFIGKKFYYFDKVTSTFDEADKLIPEDGTVVCAKTQTNGRGRLGRSWQSDTGGIYFSLILKNRFSKEKLQLMTAVCALGVWKALLEYTECKIKWPNDIISENGMKLCGILTKLRTQNGYSEYINAGIGINANTTEFPPELRYASSLKLICGHEIDENDVLCKVLEFTEKYLAMKEAELIEEYERACVTLGNRVRVIYADGENEFSGICKSMNPDGSLNIQKDDGSLLTVNSGEVSVRGVYGENYV